MTKEFKFSTAKEFHDGLVQSKGYYTHTDPILTDAQAKIICDELRKGLYYDVWPLPGHPPLLQLLLTNTVMSNEAAFAIADSIQHVNSILTLHVGLSLENFAGAMAICDMVRYNPLKKPHPYPMPYAVPEQKEHFKTSGIYGKSSQESSDVFNKTQNQKQQFETLLASQKNEQKSHYTQLEQKTREPLSVKTIDGLMKEFNYYSKHLLDDSVVRARHMKYTDKYKETKILYEIAKARSIEALKSEGREVTDREINRVFAELTSDHQNTERHEVLRKQYIIGNDAEFIAHARKLAPHMAKLRLEILKINPNFSPMENLACDILGLDPKKSDEAKLAKEILGEVLAPYQTAALAARPAAPAAQPVAPAAQQMPQPAAPAAQLVAPAAQPMPQPAVPAAQTTPQPSTPAAQPVAPAAQPTPQPAAPAAQPVAPAAQPMPQPVAPAAQPMPQPAAPAAQPVAPAAQPTPQPAEQATLQPAAPAAKQMPQPAAMMTEARAKELHEQVINPIMRELSAAPEIQASDIRSAGTLILEKLTPHIGDCRAPAQLHLESKDIPKQSSNPALSIEDKKIYRKAKLYQFLGQILSPICSSLSKICEEKSTCLMAQLSPEGKKCIEAANKSERGRPM